MKPWPRVAAAIKQDALMAAHLDAVERCFGRFQMKPLLKPSGKRHSRGRRIRARRVWAYAPDDPPTRCKCRQKRCSNSGDPVQTAGPCLELSDRGPTGGWGEARDSSSRGVTPRTRGPTLPRRERSSRTTSPGASIIACPVRAEAALRLGGEPGPWLAAFGRGSSTLPKRDHQSIEISCND